MYGFFWTLNTDDEKEGGCTWTMLVLVISIANAWHLGIFAKEFPMETINYG